MRIKCIGSGSGGNSFFLETEGKRFLIDLGLNTKAIVNGLNEVGVVLSELDGVFITHTHSDHTSALPVIKKRLKCPYYMSELSYSKLFLPGTTVLTPGVPLSLSESVFVTAQRTSHDCPGSMCFRFDSAEGSFGFATDLGFLSDEISELMQGVDALVLECNHDVQMLKEGPYPFPLKRRILSDGGHLSNDDCAKAAAGFASSGTGRIFLAHLSQENNTPAKALEAVTRAVDGRHVKLSVLSPGGNPPEEMFNIK